jgi:hypothetical protein
MPRDSHRAPTREYIAQLAARLMAEDGIEDYGAAKRKAARQAGAPNTRQLPDNEEIEGALKQYRALYCPDHPQHLRQLREQALEVMAEFTEFQPQLTGGVLKGSAGLHAPVQLQLFTENIKSVEHRLLSRGIAFRGGAVRLYQGNQVMDVPVLSFERKGVEIQMTLLSLDALRLQLRLHPAGQPLERAKRATVIELMATEG